MTREEAIQILEEEAEFLYGGDEPYNRIAFDMAIEALSANPSGDLISRVDAIDTVEELNRKVNDGRENDTICTSDVLRRIKALPSAEAVQGKWIMHGEPPWLVRECSICGEKWHHWKGYANPNYCGNCGARMKGGDSE